MEAKSKPLKIGIIGVGTVGSGVLEILGQESEFFKTQLGINLQVGGIAAKSSKSLKKWDLGEIIKTQNPMDLCTNDSIDVILELAGGYQAKEWVAAALQHKKHVVTANKAMLAKYGQELFPLAAANNCFLLFEAAVGGGIPIIRALQESLVANEIHGLACIINGTCNFILTKMAEEKRPFAEILKEAQALGYAEADPTLDVNGMDSAHKLALLASLCYWQYVNFEELHVEGIEAITPEDLDFAGQLGYSIKLLGVIHRESAEEIFVGVFPALVPHSHQLANVQGVLNAVFLKTSAAGECLLTGAGAGKNPTASSVMGDLISVGRFLKSEGQAVPSQDHFLPHNKLEVAPISEFQSEFYLRITAVDEPGVLARITAILAKHQISINSILQKPVRTHDSVSIFIITHMARNLQIQKAAEEMDELQVITQPTRYLRFYA